MATSIADDASTYSPARIQSLTVRTPASGQYPSRFLAAYPGR
jgi:hypothetical protein